MPQWHAALRKRKRSGGKKKMYRGKRAFEIGREAAETLVGERKIAARRTRGYGIKTSALACNTASVTDPSTGKSQKAQILRVVKNTSNIDYERRGVITKGAIIQTSIGEARVTSRPGQNGMVNAVLLVS